MGSLIAGPSLALGEGITHQAWHGANIQHFTIYSIITLDGLIAYHALVRRVLPMSLLGFWEAGTMACIGYQMSTHFHGGDMITSKSSTDYSLSIHPSVSPLMLCLLLSISPHIHPTLLTRSSSHYYHHIAHACAQKCMH